MTGGAGARNAKGQELNLLEGRGMLIGRVFFDRRLLRKVWHHAAAWDTKNKGHMIAFSWAIEKGDWWKYRDEEKANFLGAEWKYQHDGYTRSGIYIGRLAIIYQNSNRKE